MHPTGLVKPDDADAKIKFLAAEAMAKEWHLQIGNFRIWEDESEDTLPARRKGVTKKETTILKITQYTYPYIVLTYLKVSKSFALGGLARRGWHHPERGRQALLQ